MQVQCLFLRGDPGQQGLPTGQGCQHQGTVVGDQLLGETLDVHRLLPQLRQLCQCRCAVLRLDGVRDPEQIAAVGDACHAADHIGVDFSGDTGTGVQNGQSVPEGTVCQTGDKLRTLRRQLQLFFPGNVLHPAGNVLRTDAGKIVPLTAGKNGGRHLLDFGGGKDKDDMGRGLFQRLQQSVEGCRGQHVHLVDDVYLVPAGAGGVGGLVPQVPDVVHAVVGGGIHLHHVQQAAVVDAFADLALPAGVSVDRMQAVYRLGKDLGAGGLAGAPDAGKKVGVSHPVCGDLVFQGGDDGTLPHHIFKPLGSPLAV